MEVDTHEVFYDKLTYIYLEIPKFDKKEAELVTMYDKWMYVLKNLSNLMQRPAALQERVFTRLFEQAEISKFNKQELKLYEDSVNAYRDIVNAIRTAEKKKFAEGRAEGMAEGMGKGMAEGMEKGMVKGKAEGEKEAKEKIAANLLSLGVSVETIVQASGLPEEEIENLR